MPTKKAEEEGRKAEEEKDPRASSAVAWQQQQPQAPPPPLPHSARGETLAEASGVPSVVRYALWSLENAERGAAAAADDGEVEKKSSPLSSPSRRRLLPLLPPGKQSLLRLLAMAHVAMLETGRCWPEGREGEEEKEEGMEMREEGEEDEGAKKKAALARALPLPRRFLASLPSSASSSSLPPLAYSTLRGAAGRRAEESPPRAFLRVTSLGGAWALVSAGVSAAAPSPPSSPPSFSSSSSSSSSFPAAFSATVRLSDHFNSTDGRFLEDTSSRLWRLLCDGVASPLAAAAAASARLPPLEASLLGLPEDLLLEVLLTVAGGYEPPPEGGASKRKKEEEGEREEGGKGGQQQERERGGGGGGGSGYYACRLCRLAASGGQRGRGLASLGGLAYLWGQVPPLWPRSGRCRQEQDLVSVAGTCRALREFVLGEGSGGGGGGGATATPAAAASSPSSLLWDAVAAALDSTQALKPGGGLAYLRAEGLRARRDAAVVAPRARAARAARAAEAAAAARLHPDPRRDEALRRAFAGWGRAAEDPLFPSHAFLSGRQ
jgi:hypothetical protein